MLGSYKDARKLRRLGKKAESEMEKAAAARAHIEQSGRLMEAIFSDDDSLYQAERPALEAMLLARERWLAQNPRYSEPNPNLRFQTVKIAIEGIVEEPVPTGGVIRKPAIIGYREEQRPLGYRTLWFGPSQAEIDAVKAEMDYLGGILGREQRYLATRDAEAWVPETAEEAVFRFNTLNRDTQDMVSASLGSAGAAERKTQYVVIGIAAAVVIGIVLMR